MYLIFSYTHSISANYDLHCSTLQGLPVGDKNRWTELRGRIGEEGGLAADAREEGRVASRLCMVYGGAVGVRT